MLCTWLLHQINADRWWRNVWVPGLSSKSGKTVQLISIDLGKNMLMVLGIPMENFGLEMKCCTIWRRTTAQNWELSSRICRTTHGMQTMSTLLSLRALKATESIFRVFRAMHRILSSIKITWSSRLSMLTLISLKDIAPMNTKEAGKFSQSNSCGKLSKSWEFYQGMFLIAFQFFKENLGN